LSTNQYKKMLKPVLILKLGQKEFFDEFSF